MQMWCELGLYQPQAVFQVHPLGECKRRHSKFANLSINVFQFKGKIINLRGNMAYTLGLPFVSLPVTEQLLFAFDISAVSCQCISNLKWLVLLGFWTKHSRIKVDTQHICYSSDFRLKRHIACKAALIFIQNPP